MAKTNKEVSTELPINSLLLECTKDRYKLSYAALRWAKEIKKVENLPDAIPTLVGRAIREILGGKVSIKDVEKLPYLTRTPAPAPAPAAPAAPTLSLNVEPEK